MNIISDVLMTPVPTMPLLADVKKKAPFLKIPFKVYPKKQATALSELLSIPSFRLTKTIQPFGSLHELYDVASFAQKELEHIAGSVAHAFHAELLSSGIKDAQRAAVKIEKELAGDASRITDIVRVSVSTHSILSLTRAYQSLTKNAHALSVMNRFGAPRPSGYRDIKILLKLPKSNMIAEVQLHLSDILEIKNEKEHDIYREIQSIEREAQTSSRSLNQDETCKILALRQTSRQMYEQAWQGYRFS